MRPEIRKRNEWISPRRGTVFMGWVPKWGTTFIKGDVMITWPVYMKSVFNSYLESTVFCLMNSVYFLLS